MVDIHTHILPHFDDGPSTIEESFDLLKRLEETGVTKAVSTSHYYCNHMPFEEFVERQRRKLGEIREEILKRGMKIEVLSGAEVRIDPLMLNLESVKALCINGTDRILLEIPHDTADFEDVYPLLERIVSYYNVKPVLAHVERYRFFAKKFSNLKMLKDAGFILQVDAHCFVEKFFDKILGFKLLNAGLVDVIASDCHDLDERGPNLALAYAAIEKKMGTQVVAKLKDNAEQLLM